MKRNELAEAFAAAVRSPYSRASNLWYSEDKAFSYATPVAEKLPWVYRGRRTVWVTSQKYSQSTTIHINALLQAFAETRYRVLRTEIAPTTREELIRLLEE